MIAPAQSSATHPPNMFRELRTRNERRARTAALLEELRERRLKIDRVVLAQRERRRRHGP